MRKILGLVAILFISHQAVAAEDLRQQANTLFGVLPKTMPGAEADTAELVALGKQLYMEKRLSKNDSQSCNSCHNVENGGNGVDNQKTSPGAFGKKGGRNAPTVWNAGFQLSQFWDGRAADLVEQAKGPILNPIEMAMPDEETAVKKIQAMDNYQAAFNKAFGADNMINYDNIASAIAAFERTLITKDRFDDYLKGDDKALKAQEKKGLQAFIDTGCAACHNGATLGGNSYQKMGMVNAYANQKDQGRFEVTKKEADRMVFKVPMLRDIARTAPYFHDGSAETLEQAIEQMAWLQLGKKLDKATVEDISAFLKSMNHKG